VAHVPWRARWIWDGPPPLVAPTLARPELAPDASRFVLFRRQLWLDEVPEHAVARVTADSRYLLLVNGSPIGRGPIRGDPRRLRYDVLDLAPYLRPGNNAVAAIVRFYAEAVAWWQPAPPTYSLGGGAFLLEAEIGSIRLLTDRRWQSRDGKAWARPLSANSEQRLAETVDGRLWEPRWADPDMPGHEGWHSALELHPLHDGSDGRLSPPSHPFGALPQSPLGQPDGTRFVAVARSRRRVTGGTAHPDPVLQVEADEASAHEPNGEVELVTFDFGRIVAGFLELDVEAPSGVQIDASGAESLDAADRLARLGQHAGLRYLTRGGGERWTRFDPMGTRYVRVAIRGDARLRVALQEAHHPRPEGANFSCSDDRLEAIFEIGRRTVDLCAQDAYVDCPTREQRAWTGDSVVHQMVDLASNPDWSLARHHPTLAASPRPDGMLPMAVGGDIAYHDDTFIPDWSLHWVRSVHNLFRWTGDRQLVSSLLATAEGVLRWFVPFQRPNGLLHDVTGWVLIDWSSVYTRGASSALNALWARALEDFAEMAEWMDDRGRASWAQARRSEVAAGFDSFWDPSRHVYLDHIGEQAGRTAAQHGGSAALAAGLVPAARVDEVVGALLDRRRLVRRSWVMDTVTPEEGGGGLVYIALPPPAPDWDVEDQMVEAQPFFRYVLHDGLARAGRADLLADLCLDWQEFVDRGETTWPECWRGGTHCHGWSSTPTRDLVWYVLGVQPAAPGFEAVRVAPRPGTLDWVQGRVPTPHGFVKVRASSDEIDIDSPVPILCDPHGPQAPRRLPAGHHRVVLASSG
jgi:alpha-L-rhamnosidase